MTALQRSPERDRALDQVLPHAAERGWSWRALPDPTGRARLQELFPGGARDMVEAYCDLADRRMLDAAADLPFELRPSQRLRAALALRLAQNRPNRDAVRRAASFMALPGQLDLAARCTYRTVDALWAASGDTATDFSWYTKRASLAGIYSMTLLYWLQDMSDDDAATLAFYDRRVGGLIAIGRLRSRLRARG